MSQKHNTALESFKHGWVGRLVCWFVGLLVCWMVGLWDKTGSRNFVLVKISTGETTTGSRNTFLTKTRPPQTLISIKANHSTGEPFQSVPLGSCLGTEGRAAQLVGLSPILSLLNLIEIAHNWYQLQCQVCHNAYAQGGTFTLSSPQNPYWCQFCR